MEQNLNIDNEKNDKNENKYNVNDIQNSLEDESENNNKNNNSLISKEQINENDIINFTEILIKLKNCINDKNEIKTKNKDKRNSKKVENVSQLKNDNINKIVQCLDELIDFFSKKIINEEKEKCLNCYDLSQILKRFQSYSCPEIIEKIELICNSVINNIKDKEQIQIFIEIMINNLCYDNDKNNSNVLIISLNLIYNILEKYSFLIEPVYDIIIPQIYNILKSIKKDDAITRLFCYKILLLFIYDNVFSYNLVKTGLLSKIKEELHIIKNMKNNINMAEVNNVNVNNENEGINNIDLNNNNHINKVSINDLLKQIYIILTNLLNVNSNLIKISEELMDVLLNEFFDENYIEEDNINIKIVFFELLMEKEQRNYDIFINHKGLECILKLLKVYEKNKNAIPQIFHIINVILTYNKAYNEQMYRLKFHEQIQKIINNFGIEERDIDFNGKSLIFLIDAGKAKLEEIEEYDFNKIKSSKGESLPPHIKNFLNNGKIVKIVNNMGEIKKKYLFFTPDFLKIIAKKMNNPVNPKSKYIIDTIYIHSIVKGYGTDAFKKSKRLFRAPPESNKCFSIISFHPSEGQKNLNIICEKEAEVDKWINAMKKVISYLQENNRIKKNVTFTNNV